MLLLETVTVKIPQGLHLRAAAHLVEIVHRFRSHIKVQKGETRVDARSLLSLLTLAAQPGSELIFYFDGEDAPAASKAIRNYLEKEGGHEM
ncbi:MAG TPA: HPr family phosphocarrier protein [bacterium]|jgi:phosphotransferase system HPr (HPr) family protein|nr:HPr family phosphocarrier protein [bacterium]